MPIDFKINQYPHYDRKKFFSYPSLQFNEGINILIGCNGAGKSTLIQQIRSYCKKNDIDYIKYDNTQDGASHAREQAGYFGDMKTLANLMVCSEGEGIHIAFGQFIRSLRSFVTDKDGTKEKWILIDAVDSGFSIDNILDIKKVLQYILEHDVQPGYQLYIVISTNAYEFANGEDCINVRTGKHVKFTDYEDYKQTILQSVTLRNKLSY